MTKPPPCGEPIHLLGLTRHRLAAVLEPHLDRPFRVEQIYRALYERNAESFDEMTDLGKELRRHLTEHFSVSRPQVEERHVSADGTVKYLLSLADGATIETVDIPDSSRRTLCVSSQAGCALACRFCVTGFWGGGRNLSAGEIVAQVLMTEKQPSRQVEGLNLVFMGMGEPLLNLEAVADALDILLERISWRRVTLSTAGVTPGIRELATWKKRPRLAISLHAPDDRRRNELMPINHRYPIAELLAALEEFPLTPKEKITFEYLLIRDFNDALEDAEALAALVRHLPAKVNLIPINPDPVLAGAMRPPALRRVLAFRDRLNERGLLATIRRRRGDDVSAACGQLRAFGRQPRGFRRSQISL